MMNICSLDRICLQRFFRQDGDFFSNVRSFVDMYIIYISLDQVATRIDGRACNNGGHYAARRSHSEPGGNTRVSAWVHRVPLCP